jgi:hypothetical protein
VETNDPCPIHVAQPHEADLETGRLHAHPLFGGIRQFISFDATLAVGIGGRGRRDTVHGMVRAECKLRFVRRESGMVVITQKEVPGHAAPYSRVPDLRQVRM